MESVITAIKLQVDKNKKKTSKVHKHNKICENNNVTVTKIDSYLSA